MQHAVAFLGALRAHWKIAIVMGGLKGRAKGKAEQ